MSETINRAGSRTVHVLAPAKLNLTLEIVGRRDDGYHLLQSVMQSIDIKDIVTVTTSPERAHVVANHGAGDPNGMSVPNGERNLAYKAVAALRDAVTGHMGPTVATTSTMAEETGPESFLPGLNIDIDKRIPVAAGLGGGSADAAAALVAANELWGLGWDREALAAVGLKIGADVPFCVHGGSAIARGIGEQLTSIADVDTELWAGVVLNPGFAVSTEEVYRRYSERIATGQASFPESDATNGHLGGARTGRTAAMSDALRRGDVQEVGRLLFNVLEPVSTTMHPEIGSLRRQALRAGAIGAVMCGSGPSVFALARDVEHAAVLAARLADVAPFVGVCRFVDRGIRLVEAEQLV